MYSAVSLWVSAKDTYLKGLIKLVKSEGAMLSRYCSFAMQYFVQNRAFVHIADVIPIKSKDGYNISLTIEEELLRKIDAVAKTVGINRSKLIKTVLLNSMEKADTEFLIGEEEMIKKLLFEMAEPSKRVVVEEKPKEQPTESSPSKEEKKAEPLNPLLNNFFPSVMEQTADWD